jgi:hypothetical protein
MNPDMTTPSRGRLTGLLLAAVTAALLSPLGAARAVAVGTAPSLIGVIDSARTAWVKDGISGVWVEEMAGARKIAMSGSRIAVIDRAGTMWAKDGITGTWVREQVNVTSVALAGDGIGIVDSTGTAWLKNRLRGHWIKQRSAVRTIALSGNRIALVDSTGTMWTKDGANGAWASPQRAVKLMALSGSRIGIVDSAGTAWAEDGVHGGWVREKGAVQTIALPTWPTRIRGGACNAFAGATALGTSYTDGSSLTVPTCGPIPGHDGGPTVLPYPTAPFGTHGYQCVEFSQRFLYQRYGAREVGANGSQVAQRYAASYPAAFHLIRNGTGHLPRPGDVISESNDSNFNSDFGHTAVVQSVANGQIIIEQENYSADGAGTLTYSGTHVNPHGFTHIEWLSPR